MSAQASGGAIIGDVLAAQQVPFLFALCGGHISPILVEAKRRGIRVVDVRDEATAVFGADAVARLTGVPGVAAVTAGPGATNAVTAVKNAQLAQSPLVLLGGAAATLLRGRGALQDIDQLSLFHSVTKWAVRVDRVRDLAPALEQAFRVAQEGVPGPVFLECPVDVLYGRELVEPWYDLERRPDAARTLRSTLRNWYITRHLRQLYHQPEPPRPSSRITVPPDGPSRASLLRAADLLARAERPVLLVGSQAMADPTTVSRLVAAVERLEVPVYCSGMARGLLGARHRVVFRHRRTQALREADLVILAGVACDFRLGYGRDINRRAELISANRSRADLSNNRKPTLGLLADPSLVLQRLAEHRTASPDRSAWFERLRAREAEREAEILRLVDAETEFVNPVALCRALERVLDQDSVLVLDGGDFVGTASYVVTPRRPLSLLDPGVFGTLGVGAGFALGAKLCRPEAEVWILYGDGSAAYSLAEFDTFMRHGLPIIAVIGNDACWTQIARGQREWLGDDVGTVLRRSDYERVAEGYGGRGLRIESLADAEPVLREAKALAGRGVPVLVNALIGETDFRKGSVSL